MAHSLTFRITEGSNEDDEDEADDDEDGKFRKSQNYFCFIDPTKILLQNVNREFLGNYSCIGFNLAGYGEESEAKLLDIYYEPGNASIAIQIEPRISTPGAAPPTVISKEDKVTLICEVEDFGNPKARRFRWLRGDNLMKDTVDYKWVTEASLDTRNNFSCFAHNEGGNGSMATVSLDVLARPRITPALPHYTGFLYSEPNITLSCRVECVPRCSVHWFRDGQGIEKDDPRYFIKEFELPAKASTGDFESVLSELVIESLMNSFVRNANGFSFLFLPGSTST